MELKLIFSILIVFLVLTNLIVIPKILKNLNETTWRSRGILNLVPNKLFLEIKTNSEIIKML